MPLHPHATLEPNYRLSTVKILHLFLFISIYRILLILSYISLHILLIIHHHVIFVRTTLVTGMVACHGKEK